MLTGAVDTGEGLFMKQAHQTVLGGNLLHNLHGQLVVVCGNIGGRVDRSQLMLGRRNLIMLCLCQNAQLPQFFVQFCHESGHTGLDDAEVVVVHFLSLGGLCTEQCTSRKTKIGSLIIHFLCYEEILLLGTHGGTYTFNAVVTEQTENSQRLFVYGFH